MKHVKPHSPAAACSGMPRLGLPAVPCGLFESVFADVAIGVAVCDESQRLVYFNPEAERILGIGIIDGPPEVWAEAYGCYLPDGATSMKPEDFPLVRALRGEPSPRELIFIRNPRQPAGIWIDVTGHAIRDERGALRGGVAVFCDVTLPQITLRRGVAGFAPDGQGGREAGGAAEHHCAAISERFSRLREMYTLLCGAVEQTADTIIITDTDGIIEYVNPAFEETTGYTAAEVLGRTPRVLKSGRHSEQFYRDLWERIASGQPFRGTLINRKKSGELYWTEQTISPIRENGGPVTHFVSVLKDITALREKQEHEFNMQLAREVQQRYYNSSVSIPGFDIAGAAFPAAETGGDYFDFLPQPDGSVLIALADIAGHGFGSAFVMAETRATLRAYATMLSDPPALLRSVNGYLAASLAGYGFVTMFLGRLDPRRHVLEYASAGHETGYVLRDSGEIGAVIDSTAPPLGIFADQDFCSARTIALEPGDTIVLLTDGVADAAKEEGVPLGASAALDFIRCNRDRSARDLIQGLYEAARDHAGGRQDDDITAVICKMDRE